MSRFVRGGWFPYKHCLLNKKAKIDIHQGVNKTKLKSETTNPSNFAFFLKIDVGNELSSQEVALQVLSPLRVFTTVFGMGTGGFLLLGHQQTFVCCLPIILGFQLIRWKLHKIHSSIYNFFRKSPRPISNARLKMLPLLHLHPIYVVIYNGTY